MKILYIHQYFAIPSGGGATRSYEMARRMVQAGHEVTMLTSSAFLPSELVSGEGWHRVQYEGIVLEILKLPYSNRMPFWKRILRFIQFLIKVTLRARRWRGDVVFATSTPLTVAIPGVITARRNRLPMVFEVRDLWPELPIAIGALRNPVLIWMAKWLERYAYRNASRVVALSPGMAEGVADTGFPAERIHMIPNGCDAELFAVTDETCDSLYADFPFLDKGPLVVYTGTFGKINGVDYLVEMAKSMRSINPEIQFVLVGDGADADLIRETAENAGLLNNSVHILSPLTKFQVACLLRKAAVATSLFVNLPEMWNNSANKFFDALASGCPVMINYGGWQAKLLDETGAGITVRPDDPEHAAVQLADFVSDSERRGLASRAAKKLATERFDRDMLAEELIQVLQMTSNEGVRQ